MGAVVITGETARKGMPAKFAGVERLRWGLCSCYCGARSREYYRRQGACAHQYSQEHHTSVVNIDIGGGTSNFAAFHEGDVIDTGCFDIGGRLIKIDPNTLKIRYISPKLQEIIKKRKFKTVFG